MSYFTAINALDSISAEALSQAPFEELTVLLDILVGFKGSTCKWKQERGREGKERA